MKKTILSILSIVITFAAIGQNIKGYTVTAFDTLRARKMLHMDTSYSTSGTELPGTLFWDEDNLTLSLQVPDGGVIQINQEPHDYYHNLEGTSIINGDIVSTFGASGNRTAICLTDATNDEKALAAFGMVTVDVILNNNVGRITKSGGKVRGLNTSSYSEGTKLYVDPLNKGKWTSTMPSAPYRAILIGTVTVSHAVNGVVELHIQVLPKLTELSDVNGTPLTTTGQIPVWNQDSGYFDFDYNIKGYLTSYTETDPIFTSAFSGLYSFSIPYKTLLGNYLASYYTIVGDKAIIRTDPGNSATSKGDFLLQVFGNSYSTGQAYSGLDATTDSSLVRFGQVKQLISDSMQNVDLANYYTKTELQTSGQSSVHWDNITNEPTFLTGNQTITLSGDVSGSGTTAITTTVANDSHTHNNTTAPGTYSSLTSLGGLGTSGSDLYLSSINAAGGTPALTEYVHSLPSSGSTVKAVTWQAVRDMMGVSSGTVTSVGMTTPTGLTVTGSPITTSGTLALSLTSGYSIPTTANQTNWTAGYNDKINSAAFSTSTGVLTLTQQDAGTITVDLDGKYNEMWVDQTGRTYLSDTNEDLIIGSSTDAGAFKIQAVTSTTSGAGLYVSSTGTNSEGLYVSSSGTAGRGALITGTSYGVQSGGAINDFYGSNSGNIRLVEKASAAATATSSGVFYALSNGTAGYRNSSGADFNLTGTSMPTRTVSTSVTLGMTDYLVFLSSGANITLPTASSYTGKIYILRNTSSGAITISSYTVLGPSNATSVAAYQSVTVASNGSGWYQLN